MIFNLVTGRLYFNFLSAPWVQSWPKVLGTLHIQIRDHFGFTHSTLFGLGGGEGWTVRCFVPLMHFCIGKYQSVPRLLAMIVVNVFSSVFRSMQFQFGSHLRLRSKDSEGLFFVYSL